MKKNYVAPSAELICLAPCETIATKPWEWNPKNGMQNHWYQTSDIEITSVNSWIPFDGIELNDQ